MLSTAPLLLGLVAAPLPQDLDGVVPPTDQAFEAWQEAFGPEWRLRKDRDTGYAELVYGWHATSPFGPVDATDVFQFSGTNLPPGGIAAIVYSDSVISPPATTGNGLLFLQPGGALIGGLNIVGTDGTLLLNPGILAWLGASAPTAGQTAFFQLLYQDPGGPCGGTMNLTNGVKLIL